MFNKIARRYDLLNALMSLGLHRGWRRLAIDALKARPGGTYLDIGTGTGDIAKQIAQGQAGALVIGLDPAAEMLDIAIKSKDRGNLQGKFLPLLGDGHKLPFQDNCFQGVISAFCIRNMDDRERALSEMQRVLETEEILIVLELTRPQNIAMDFLHSIYNRTVLPALGYVFSEKVAYDYLQKSIEDFPCPSDFGKVIETAGFYNVEFQALSGGIVTLFSALCKQP